VRSGPALFYKSLGFILAAIVAICGAILGWYQEVGAQLIIFYAAATFALIIWGWHQLLADWSVRQAGPTTSDHTTAVVIAPQAPAEADNSSGYFAELLRTNRTIVILLLLVAAAFAIASFAIDGFFTLANAAMVVAVIAYGAGAYGLSRVVRIDKSAFIGISVLLGLFIVGALAIDGFASATNIRSMLLFASFLGLACIGQTLVALLGGLDLSIPFVIGSSNIGLLYLISLGIPPWLAFIVLLCLGVGVGFVNGMLSFRLQGQALIVTLGVGFAISGGTQIITSTASTFGGNVFGRVPDGLINIATMNGNTFGLKIPAVILIWGLMSLALIFGLKNTKYGRNLYALGGSRVAADRLSISERAYWVGTYMISGCGAAFTGALLLGWSGGGFIGVGDPYLFMTLAAVVVGGTSLLGGWGGYGFTVIGVLVLQVLTSFLVGIGLSFQAQQFVFGLLILPMVAIYGRSPHIRTQI
jgi:ribose transport system permease protein